MSWERLLAVLERDGAREARTLVEQARAQARRIDVDATEQRDRARTEGLANLEAEVRAEIEAAVGERRRASRQALLESRHRLLQRVRSTLERRLDQVMSEVCYQDALRADLDATLGFVASRPVVVRCAPALVRPLAALVDETAGLAVEADPGVHTGFRVLSRDGRLVVDATLETRLAQLWPQLSIDVLRLLEQGA